MKPLLKGIYVSQVPDPYQVDTIVGSSPSNDAFYSLVISVSLSAISVHLFASLIFCSPLFTFTAPCPLSHLFLLCVSSLIYYLAGL